MVRVGIIGLGYAGKIHLEKLSQNEYVEVTALCDIEIERAENMRDYYMKMRKSGKVKPKAFSRFEEIIPLCDAVFVATPANTHYEILKTLIQEKKYVFVEKPLTTRYKDAEELKELSEKNNIFVQVGHVERFNDAYVFGKRFVKFPGYIKAERLSQFPGRGTDTDVIFDVMIHDIDAIVGFLNSVDIDFVDAMGIPVLTDKPDIAMVRIKFSSGYLADLTASRVAYRKFRKMRIFQPGIYVSIDFLEKRTEVYRKEKENGKFEIKAIIKSFENSDPMKQEIDSFINTIIEGKKPEVPLDEALKSVFIAEKIKEAMFFMHENSIG